MSITVSPKAFFFDFDGVICDSEKAHMASTLHVISEYGIEFSEHYYFQKLFGFDDKGLFEHLFDLNGKKLNAALLKELIEKKNHSFMDMVEKHVIFFDGVKDLILRLDQAQIPMAVVSGALSEEVEHCLKKGDIRHFFKFMVCADHVNRSKPDPESYEKATLEMMSLVPDLEQKDILVLEDSPTGISSAKGANLEVIAITNSAPPPMLREADYIVSHYNEIILPQS